MKTVIIQEKLLRELKSSIAQRNLNKRKNKLKIDVAVYFMSLLNSVPSFYRSEEQSNYVSLDSQRLKKIHSRYNMYFDFFIKHGFLLIHRNYGADINECTVYKIPDNYLKDKIVSYELTHTFILDKFNDNGLNEFEQSKNLIAHESRPHLLKNFDSKLSIKASDAFKEIEHFKDADNTLRKYITSAYMIKEYCKQEWKFSIKKESDNRLHTNLTRTPKILRKHIRYKGMPIVGIDLKTSQPFFLCILLKAILNKDKTLLKRVRATNVLSEETINQLFNISADKHELLNFMDLVLNNDFYTEFEELLNISKDESGKPSRLVYNSKKGKKHRSRSSMEHAWSKKTYKTKRDLVKDVVMEIFYSKPRTTIKEAKVFRGNFPSVAKIFKCLHDNKVKFSYLLQYIEAYILLDYTAKEIVLKYPNMPLFSIHDALVTTSNWVEVLEEEMYHYIKKVTSLAPNLELEDWIEIKK